MIKELYQIQERGAKALPYRVELTDAGGPLISGGGPASYNEYNGFNSVANISGRSPLSQREARIHMQTYGGSESIDWLMDAVNYVATAASSAALSFKAQDGTTLAMKKQPQDPPDTKMAPQAAIDLFKRPNPYMCWEDLCDLLLIDYLIVGNAYWVKWPPTSGSPLALYRMAPQYVKIEPGQFGPKNYLYRLPGDQNDTVFTPDQVVHFKRPNPHDPYYGMGIVQGGARPLDMEIELTKTGASYYAKQALPSGVVQTDRRVPKDVFNKLKQQIRTFYARSHNAGSLMVLESGLQYKPISPNAQEAMFQTMGGWSRDRIFAMFNMNKSLVGIWDQGDNPQLGQWQSLFDAKTMIPLTKRLAGAISYAITQPSWNIDLCIDYETTQMPDDVLNRAGTLAKLPGVKIHEVRDAARLAPSTGDKEVDDMVLNKPGPELGPTGQGGVADPNLPSEPGRPPKPENTQQFARRTGKRRAPPAAVGGTKSLDSILSEIDAHLEDVKALAPADHVHVGKLQGEHVIPPQDTLHAKRTTALDSMISDVESELKAAATELKRALIDEADGKAENSAYDRIKNSKAWKVFRDRVEKILSNAATDAMSQSNSHHGAQGLDTAEIDYETEAKALAHRKDGGVASLLKTVKQKVLAAVGKDNADVTKAITEQISQWQNSNAAQAAIDTVTASYNSGTLEVAEANGSSEVLVSDGTDFDAPCIEANGQTWTLDKARDNLQQHSRCRRAFVLLPS